MYWLKVGTCVRLCACSQGNTSIPNPCQRLHSCFSKLKTLFCTFCTLNALKTYKLGEFSKFFILTIMYSRKSRFWSTFSLIQHTRILKWLWEKKIENFTYFFKMVSFQQAIIFTRCKHEWRIHTVAHMTHHHHHLATKSTVLDFWNVLRAKKLWIFIAWLQ